MVNVVEEFDTKLDMFYVPNSLLSYLESVFTQHDGEIALLNEYQITLVPRNQGRFILQVIGLDGSPS